MNQPVDIIKLLSIVSSCPKGYMLFFSSLGRMEFVCVYMQENLSHNVFIHRFSFLSEMKVKCFIEVGSSLRVQRGVFGMRSSLLLFQGREKDLTVVIILVNLLIIFLQSERQYKKFFVLSEHLFVSSSAFLQIWPAFVL